MLGSQERTLFWIWADSTKYPVFVDNCKCKYFRPSSDIDPSFLDEKNLLLVKNGQKPYLERNVTRNFPSDPIFQSLENIQFCSFWKGLFDEQYQNYGHFSFYDKVFAER
jgi:hypothetical protein